MRMHLRPNAFSALTVETGRFVDTFVEGKGGTIVFFPAASSSDLAAVDLQIPPGVVLGADLEITYTVTNHAAPTGVHEWDDVLYLSVDDIFDASDEELARTGPHR